MAFQIAKLKSDLCRLRRRFLRFSKASFFLSGDQLTFISNNILSAAGLVLGNTVAECSFLGFLIVFIRQNSGWDSPWQEALLSTARDCVSAFLASFLAYATHQRIRPFTMILVNHAIFIAGMLILRFDRQNTNLFFLALALLSVDVSAKEYMKEFLTEQSTVNQSEQVTDQLTVNQSEQVTDQPAVNQSEQVTDQLTVNQLEQVTDQPAVNQSEQVTGQPTVNQSEQVIDDAEKSNNQIDAWWFIAGSAGSVLGGVLISRLPTSKQLYISAILVGIGCILVSYYCIRYEVSLGDHEGERHELRPLLKLLPLWAPFLIFYVVDAACSAIFDYNASFYLTEKVCGILVSRLISDGITKLCSKVNQQVQLQQCIRLTKIIIGMLVCFLLCIVTWHAQAERKSDGSSTYLGQFILLGIMKEMVKEMLGEYFCDQVPDQSMHHLEFTFNSFVEGMGRLLAVVCILVSRNWIDGNIEKIGNVVKVKNSQLDKCFRTLAFMSLCALLMFVYLSNTCYWKEKTEDHEDNNLEMMEEGRVSLNSSHSLESQSYFPSNESISASSEAALLPNLESAGSSANRDYWSMLRRYIKERWGMKEKSS